MLKTLIIVTVLLPRLAFAQQSQQRQLLRPLKGPQGAGRLRSVAGAREPETADCDAEVKDMAYASVTVKDLVERSVNHKWSIPELQRGFVWKATQVRDLIDSLWLNYPVGTLLVWDSSGPVNEECFRRTGSGSVGSRRTTAHYGSMHTERT
jgi:hypothetical protein